MYNSILKFKKEAITYWRDLSAGIAVAFAIMAPVMLGAAGFALDYSSAYLVQQRLAQALDAATLAAAASSGDPDEIQQKVEDFFAVNYPPEKLGATVTPSVSVIGSEITVTGSAQYNTFFLSLIGIGDIDVEAETVVQKEIQGIEVALVLDVTGSMSTNNNIGTLREASTKFVNILFDRAASPDLVKIGLVPYSTAVNVGPYGLGYDLDGAYYGEAFVNNPDDLSFHLYDYSKWRGCVQASESPLDTQDHEGPWDMYAFDCKGAWPCTWYYNQYWKWLTRQNTWCTKNHIIPLTSDRNILLDQIHRFQARGSTLGNLGMVWGYRLISPEYPFEEGSPWGDETYRKAIVMMTDGENFVNDYYTAYGPSVENDVSVSDLNDRFLEVCTTLKEDHDVTVYTITFASGVGEETKDFYRECATSESQFFDAPDQESLVEVFETISRELSNLRISK